MADLTQFKYDPEAATRFFQQTKNIPEWAQRDLFAAQFKPPGQSELAQAINALNQIRKEERDPAFQKQQLQNALEFQKEQMRQAAPYKMLFELPDKLYSAFALPGQIRLAGAQAAGNVISEGLRSAAMVQMPNLNYQRPNIQYF